MQVLPQYFSFMFDSKLKTFNSKLNQHWLEGLS
jgi:hypothetical protein